MRGSSPHTIFRIIANFLLVVTSLLVSGVSAADLQEISTVSIAEKPVRAIIWNDSNQTVSLAVSDTQILDFRNSNAVSLNKFNSQKDRVWRSHQNLIVESVQVDSNNNGNIHWRILDGEEIAHAEYSREFSYDALLPQLYTDQSTKHAAIVDPWEWTVTFYFRNSEVKTVHLPAEQVQHLYETGYVAEWSADGNTFALATSLNSPESKNRQVSLFLFNQNGNELLKKDYPMGYVSGLAIADDAEKFMLSGYNLLNGSPEKIYYMLSSDSEVLRSNEGIALDAKFFGEQQAIVWGRRFIDAYENIQQEPSWRQTFTSDKKTMCLDATDTKNGTIILRGTSTPKDGEFVFTNPQVIWYNSRGLELDSFQFEDEYLYEPFMKYNPADKILRVGTAEKIHTLQLIQ